MFTDILIHCLDRALHMLFFLELSIFYMLDLTGCYVWCLLIIVWYTVSIVALHMLFCLGTKHLHACFIHACTNSKTPKLQSSCCPLQPKTLEQTMFTWPWYIVWMVWSTQITSTWLPNLLKWQIHSRSQSMLWRSTCSMLIPHQKSSSRNSKCTICMHNLSISDPIIVYMHVY